MLSPASIAERTMNRQVGPSLDDPGQAQAVHPRHHHVHDDEVGLALLEPAQRLHPVARRGDEVAVVTQLLGQEDEEVGVVVHEEDPVADPRPGLSVRRSACPEYRQARWATQGRVLALDLPVSCQISPGMLVRRTRPPFRRSITGGDARSELIPRGASRQGSGLRVHPRSRASGLSGRATDVAGHHRP